MTFNSHEPNVLHYLTFVSFQRVKVFRSDEICQFFIDAIRETREKHPFKLVAYVIMPDHVHLIVNPLTPEIETIGKELKGRSAHKSIKWLKEEGHAVSLDKLKRRIPGKRNHSYSLWQEKVKSIDLKSEKFVQQKVNYIHMNPVRAGLCDHPAKWKWSSYHAHLPHDPGDVPIEMDKQAYWTEEELQHTLEGGGRRPPLNDGECLITLRCSRKAAKTQRRRREMKMSRQQTSQNLALGPRIGYCFIHAIRQESAESI